MAQLPTGRRGQILAVALLLLLAVAAWQAVAAPLIATYTDRADAIEQRSALVARMAQVAADLPQLTRRSTQSVVAAPAQSVLLQGGSDAVSGAGLQQRLQELAAQTGAKLSSTETLPAEAAGTYRRISVRVSMAAPWPVLVRLLQAMADATPAMLVDDMQLRGGPPVGPGQEPPLDLTFTAFGFRVAGTDRS